MHFAIGQPVPRTEDPRLLKGGGQYADDFSLPGQVYAAMVRSPHAHAEILSIDPSEALQSPGALAVLMGSDYAQDALGEIVGNYGGKRRDGQATFRPSRPAITSDRVRHVGEIVAVVIAERPELAKDAAEYVDVQYEVLPATIDTATANCAGAPPVWSECPDNEAFFHQVGDSAATQAALAAAPNRLKRTFRINRVHANTMEPRAALGNYHSAEQRYTLYCGSQRPFSFREALSRHLFRVQENQISLVTGDVGGSFGMKGGIYPEIPLVAWASRRVGRPVKWTCERSEAFLADDHARDNVTTAEIGFDDEGKVFAVAVRSNVNLGAYFSYNAMGPAINNLGTLAGQYTISAMHADVSAVFTNTNPLSPYRGAGRPEAAFIIESMMEAAAAHLGLNAVELRRRNLIPSSAMPYKTALVYTYDCGEFEVVLDKCLTLADYSGFEERRDESEARAKWRGIGVSTSIEIAARLQPETAELRFDPSGSATLLVGTTSHGQGHETVFKQIVCDRLGLEPEQIRLVTGDTDKVPFGTGTGGSRVSALGTAAVLGATNKVLHKATLIAGHLMEVAPADVSFESGRFVIPGTDRSVTWADVVSAAFKPASLPADIEMGLFEIASFNPEKENFPNACHVCEVEIDPETGQVSVVKYTVVDDVGTELNPLLLKGQIHGGIAQGLGQALFEDIVFDTDNGQLLSGSFMDYCMPRADDFCDLVVDSHPVPTDTNPLGAKGAGESGAVGALPAVLIAVNQALTAHGATPVQMPASPERVWRAIQGSD